MVKTIGDLQSILSQRAVEVVTLAVTASPENERRLQELVDPGAIFSLGSGDVGMPLGSGLIGAKSMTAKMRPDRFRFDLWSYIPTPIDNPCGMHKVEVEFFNTAKRNAYRIEFTFEAGRLIAARGWTRWYEEGPIVMPM